ncbi:MAG: hypothetical protein JNK76_26865 [Planctomycetales bacterium]|nr:hypothetical protein [Planctomycetales bacterium]
MDYPELGITRLEYSDEHFAYYGTIRIGGVAVDLHFPLREPATEVDVIEKYRTVLSGAIAKSADLIRQAQANVPHGDCLPPVSALLVYDRSLDLQFGSSNPDDRHLWYEAMYQPDCTLYHFEKHAPSRQT